MAGLGAAGEGQVSLLCAADRAGGGRAVAGLDNAKLVEGDDGGR